MSSLSPSYPLTLFPVVFRILYPCEACPRAVFGQVSPAPLPFFLSPLWNTYLGFSSMCFRILSALAKLRDLVYDMELRKRSATHDWGMLAPCLWCWPGHTEMSSIPIQKLLLLPQSMQAYHWKMWAVFLVGCSYQEVEGRLGWRRWAVALGKNVFEVRGQYGECSMES